MRGTGFSCKFIFVPYNYDIFEVLISSRSILPVDSICTPSLATQVYRSGIYLPGGTLDLQSLEACSPDPHL